MKSMSSQRRPVARNLAAHVELDRDLLAGSSRASRLGEVGRRAGQERRDPIGEVARMRDGMGRWNKKERKYTPGTDTHEPVLWQSVVLCDLVGGKNRSDKNWTKNFGRNISSFIIRY
jgi:hypothetical protein